MTDIEKSFETYKGSIHLGTITLKKTFTDVLVVQMIWFSREDTEKILSLMTLENLVQLYNEGDQFRIESFLKRYGLHPTIDYSA